MRSAVSEFPNNLNPPQTAQSAIGQFSVRATPLQMAMVGAAVANRGELMSPYLVQDVRGPDLSVARRHQARVARRGHEPAVGTAAHRDDGQRRRQRHRHQRADRRHQGGGQDRHRAAGRGRRPHAWFVSFAPAENPRVAVAVIIENGGDATEISGNQLAAPIARAVMRAVLGR